MAQDAGTQAAGAADPQPPVGAPLPVPGGAASSGHPLEGTVEAPEVTLRTIRVVRWGIALWVLALVAVLALPSLREGERDWWVWVPVAGIVLGGIGHVYLARGRGNAADA
ncbi:class II D-tagatose-bisphosphate aldolase, non-catalytic subunit [Ornithinimicrobium sp. F0845]|uniref:DUF2530 domain-containing protein n=1 Tax=Ornithinimicrobium sp. F0845 TaxID=2926412 RepID=UPI001FF67C35|nr:DUF2530 domain-containing protein [Ornithinimicrobium sp. F0845]MCK0113657.1 class II D-tagatose-bisphosphate aldolase, non-catalytic subunit [Ornithinimicrobium sp. F0845]